MRKSSENTKTPYTDGPACQHVAATGRCGHQTIFYLLCIIKVNCPRPRPRTNADCLETL